MHSRQATKSLVSLYLRAFEEFLEPRFLNVMDQVSEILDDARRRGATIFIAGNGGSASTGSHWVNDLGKATKSPNRSPVRVISLTDNVSWITALANDEGYDRIFTGQLENLAEAGDVLIVISASGNSPNLLDAVSLAQSREVTTIALVGFDGGALKNKVDVCLWLPTAQGEYGIVESAHSALCHMLTTCLTYEAERPMAMRAGAAVDAR